MKLCADPIADRFIKLNVFFSSALVVVDGLGLLFFLTAERTNHRAIMLDCEGVHIVLIRGFKAQHDAAIFVTGSGQKLLAVQALADGVNVGGVKKVLHCFVLSVPYGHA